MLKYLGIKLTKDMNYLYDVNYKMLKNEKEEDIKRDRNV